MERNDMNALRAVAQLGDHLLESSPSAKPEDGWTITPEITPANMDGDVTVNCFKLAGTLKRSPMEIADAGLEFLNDHPDVESVEKVKAFLNVVIKPEALHRDAVADVPSLLESAKLAEGDRKRILIEFSAPNTNKPQHLGHVRNNTLGMAIGSLFDRVGHDVVPVNLVNDRGVHICKSMIAYQRFGDGVTPETAGVKGDHLVGDFYVKYNEALTQQLKTLRSERPELEDKTDDELFLETEIGQATQEMLRDWEDGDAEVRALWKMMNDWVFEGFDVTYRRMGVEFDETFLESDTYLLGKDIVETGVEQGVFFRRNDGAVVVDLGKMGEKVVLRSDGTSVYITQDLGTTLEKQRRFKPDRQIWVVGDEQILHFKQLFAILKKLGYDWADGLFHLAYGMVNLPSGKMKSREGTVVDADDLFDQMFELAKAGTLERCGDEVPDDIDERAEIIAMGALKFMLLKFNPKSTVMFDPDASVKFEGDTGPYVQYACARINSIERKGIERGAVASQGNVDWSLLGSSFEKSLALRIHFYPDALRLAAERVDPSVLANYLLDLAKDFSRFYRECPVLNAPDEKLRSARLALCEAARDVLSDGLKTLTVKVPEAM